MNKKIFQKKIQRNFIQLHISFEPEIYPYIVSPPLLRIDALTLCSISVPSSIVDMYNILNYVRTVGMQEKM